MRVLTLSDSDSYLKWAVALTAAAPPRWAVRHLVLDNVIAPSAAQIAAVLRDHPGRPVGRVSGVRLARTLRDLAPDVLLVAATGPAIEAIRDLLAWGGVLGPDRPVLATGLPGISFPANEPAIRHRRDFDVMILHSHREITAYADVIARVGFGPRLALATLPFLSTVAPADPGGRAVVFAAQALVPATAQERCAILAALSALPTGLDPVVKVRALPGERQAHNEDLPYADLWAQLEQRRPIGFVAGSMAAALRDAAGFVTVSSTAALEAIAAGVPSLVLDEFGVTDELINTVFLDSGLLGGLDRLAAGEFSRPRPAWLHDNYFHPAADDDWIAALEQAVAARRGGAGRVAVATAAARDPWSTRARRQLRVLPPAWVWRGLQRLRPPSG
ncbi:DUF6716 putative glycosyltransferase [Granulicoccus sp. GXG6511]|uniref:DUF6716 putative glycosyltransferase n=1 Tax=Granulicoccus sp. GXG6511 TaxID=3381351 RepID=UPI003D7D8F76